MDVAMERKAAQCAKHGAYETCLLFGRVWSKCPQCVAEADQAEKDAQDRREAEARMHRLEALVARAAIPERFADRTLENYVAELPEQQRALAFAKRYAEGFASNQGRCAVFVGRPGTGKTHLACGIAHAVMRQGYTALFATVLQALRIIKDAWGRGALMSESQAIRQLVMPDLLILDEVGVQYGTETEKTLLFEILNARYEARRPAILLSNLETKDMQAYLGARVMDRMREDGAVVTTFNWESHRGK